MLMRRSLQVEVKKLKIDEEIDVQFDPDTKEEPNEPEDYTTSPVQIPTK
jgi:hypothetical protein